MLLQVSIPDNLNKSVMIFTVRNLGMEKPKLLDDLCTRLNEKNIFI